MAQWRMWSKRVGEVCCCRWQRSLTYAGIAVVFLSPSAPDLFSRCSMLP